MNEFWLWFSTGISHILDWNGYDHILYVVVLCAMFSIQQWKQLLLLVTAFTIGHSLTLAASVFNFIHFTQIYIEVLIPLTIMLTCINTIFWQKGFSPFSFIKNSNIHQTNEINYKLHYVLALVFGFVHGMGFSYLLKSMIGKQNEIIFPLLSFNLGLEIGQLIIVGCMLLFSFILIRFTQIKKTYWAIGISVVVCLISFLLFIQRLKFIV